MNLRALVTLRKYFLLFFCSVKNFTKFFFIYWKHRQISESLIDYLLILQSFEGRKFHKYESYAKLLFTASDVFMNFSVEKKGKSVIENLHKLFVLFSFRKVPTTNIPINVTEKKVSIASCLFHHHPKINWMPHSWCSQLL